MQKFSLEQARGNFKRRLSHDGAWQVHRLAFAPEEVPEDAQKKASNLQTSMAGLLPSKLWTTEFTEIIWMVKVTAKGITPVRPVVICKKPFVLQKEHFLQLRGGQ